MKMCIPSSLIKAPSPLTFGSCSSQHNSSEVQTYNVTEYEWSAWLKNLPCMCKIVYQKTEGIQSSTITNQRHNDKLSRYLDMSDGIRFMLLQKWTQNNGTISLWQVVAKQLSYHEVKTRNMASKITKKPHPIITPSESSTGCAAQQQKNFVHFELKIHQNQINQLPYSVNM